MWQRPQATIFDDVSWVAYGDSSVAHLDEDFARLRLLKLHVLQEERSVLGGEYQSLSPHGSLWGRVVGEELEEEDWSARGCGVVAPSFAPAQSCARRNPSRESLYGESPATEVQPRPATYAVRTRSLKRKRGQAEVRSR